eukprot:symbB.v1.2.007825.t1/scaffold463.1/size291460/6
MSKVTFDAIKRATAELQDALYTRQPPLIRQQIEVARDQNKVKEGPSSKAILQAEEYARKLEDYEKDQEAQREQEEAELRQEAADLDLAEALVPSRAGKSQAGFASNHPLQRARGRLFVKILLRRARAYELLGQPEESLGDLRAVWVAQICFLRGKVETGCKRQTAFENLHRSATLRCSGPCTTLCHQYGHLWCHQYGLRTLAPALAEGAGTKERAKADTLGELLVSAFVHRVVQHFGANLPQLGCLERSHCPFQDLLRAGCLCTIHQHMLYDLSRFARWS